MDDLIKGRVWPWNETDLIARLLAEETNLTDCAADRIEELEKERDYTEGTNDTLIALNQSLEAKLAECEARLRKAGEGLTVIDALDPEGLVNGCSQSALIGLVLHMGEIARATLEEISSPTKGADHD